MDNLPSEFSATVRRGATFGPVVFTVSGLNLTLYNLSAGVGADDAVPTISSITTVQTSAGPAYRFSVTLPSALTNTLKYRATGSQASGNNDWWVDASLISDPTVIVPIAGGVLTVVQRGAHD